ncbi:hypothetical protein SAMN02745134_00561 [Clostridium acidisoli DSM 12555]|uniref:Nitroreductase n=1 Tax=Clostridium acidisoli DSM 12555 TaxID=1121291 RepID=A0A1W1X3M4_9CLOT|nr:hypothetical protein [Clostridium acidisoli]SMC18433.1 hypothetical protein SAMN02745134_00561 [Clostridium acidisoli DSM 12555]
MLFIIESIILCSLFTLIVVPSTLKDPLKQIDNYPPAIRQRVKSLPDYNGKIPTNKKVLSTKIIGIILFVVMFSILVYLSGARKFVSAFTYTFGLCMIINLFDVLILDIAFFCHYKRYRIPGTEDMVKEYESPWFHIIGGVKGIFISIVISIMSAGLIVAVV